MESKEALEGIGREKIDEINNIIRESPGWQGTGLTLNETIKIGNQTLAEVIGSAVKRNKRQGRQLTPPQILNMVIGIINTHVNEVRGQWSGDSARADIEALALKDAIEEMLKLLPPAPPKSK